MELYGDDSGNEDFQIDLSDGMEFTHFENDATSANILRRLTEARSVGRVNFAGRELMKVLPYMLRNTRFPILPFTPPSVGLISLAMVWFPFGIIF